MVTNDFDIIYSNESKNGKLFLLEARDGIRDYTKRGYLERATAEAINERDKLLVITGDRYPYKTEDVGEMLYHLLKNKVLLSSRQAEIDKIYPYIRRAFTED